MNAHILIVDDDRDYALELKNALLDVGEIDLAHSVEQFHLLFSPYRYDLILLDLRLKEGKEGLELLDYISGEDPRSVVIIISGYGDIPTAIEALQKGAQTFLEKGKVSPQEIRIRIEHALVESERERYIRHLERSQEIEELIGKDPKIEKVRQQIDIAAQNGNTTVLVTGETGTGKELVARAMHRIGIRKKGPFVVTPLVEKNPETITSELFGHEKGAFTGAVSRRFGCFEEAHKGILFLDEIGDLPLDIQTKLLRVLDQKTFRRMGGNKDIKVDIQVVSATNRHLKEMINEGTFREDLYYRINTFEIYLPPLRERQGDIPLLAVYFLNQLRKKGTTTAGGFSDDTVELMLDYQWAGNVRELQSVVMRAALMAKHDGKKKISRDYLEPALFTRDGFSQARERNIHKALAETELRMVENALIMSGGRKTEAWKLLEYRNRFSMLRRVKRILGQYPDMASKFPEVMRNYSQN